MPDNADDVLRDPKLRCLVEELRSHTADEVVAVLRALFKEAADALNDGPEGEHVPDNERGVWCCQEHSRAFHGGEHDDGPEGGYEIHSERKTANND